MIDDNAGNITSTNTTISKSIIGPISLEDACSPFCKIFALCSSIAFVASSDKSRLKSAVPRFKPDMRNVENLI